MFWRYGAYANISPINTLLDRPDVTVEDVLDESELLHELKQHNSKLIEFIREDHVLKRMLEYIVSPSLLSDDDDDDDDGDHEENEDDSANRRKSLSCSSGLITSGDGHQIQKERIARDRSDSLGADIDLEELQNAEKARLKYAYISSEVLSAPSWSIIEAMMLNEESLLDFWHFLWGKTPLDSLQSSYFYKVNEVLLDQKTPDMLAFIMSLDDVVETMLKHVDNPSVMDLLLKIITLDSPGNGLGITEWLCSQNFIPVILSYITTEHSASTQTAAGDFIKALITISANAAQNEQPCIGPNSLTRQLVSEPCLLKLVSIMLQGGNPLTVAVGIVIDIIRKNNPDYDSEPLEGRDATPSIRDPIYLGTLLRVFANHVPDFVELILSSNRTVNEGGVFKITERRHLSTAWGSQVEPLGFDRFKTCELMAELLHCSNMGLHNEPGSDEYMQLRDAERQRSRTQGVLGRQVEDSGFVYADNSHEFGNGVSPSALGSGSPDEIKRIDSSTTGEDDGFEDVGSPSVLLEAKLSSGSTQTQETKPDIENSSHLPKLGMRDDLVEEPLTPPLPQTLPNEKLTGNSDSRLYITQDDPISPTSSGLTDKVRRFYIDSNDQFSPTVNETYVTTPKDITAVATDGVPQPSKSNNSIALSSTSSPHLPELQTQDESRETQTTKASINEQVLTPDEMGKFSHYIQKDPDGRPVVGDYLKMMFYTHKVLPTILSFFFRFPWNNFLHNVVYDVIQQALNGSMDQGFNRILVVNLFESATIPAQIVKGQRESDEAQSKNGNRLGYMGHLTLISEEVVKFTERLGTDALPPEVMQTVLHPDWVNFVENTLAETRERDNAILGGVKPDMSMGHRQAVLNAISGGNQGFGTSAALSNAGLNGEIPSSGFEGLGFSNQGTVSGGVLGYGTGTASLFSGFGSSSDDEDEEMEDSEDIQKSSPADEDGFNSENVGQISLEDVDMTDSQPIAILPPPPTSLSSGPSRARRQLAARLAAQKLAAEKAAVASATLNNDTMTQEASSLFAERDASARSPVNPFLSIDEETDLDPNTELEFVSPFAVPGDGAPSSKPSFLSGFKQSTGTFSSSSSEGDETIEAVQRNYRLPLEVYDDDDLSHIPPPAAGFCSYSDDEDEETLIRETIGYSEFFGPECYANNNAMSSTNSGPTGNSDDEDEGLVEILVPGRRATST
ncbi:sporulation-induced protein [Ophidiomyces ophidiicola]|nr:sporulation-induced protein [Ophidiomyces ophidiicola]